MSINTLIKSLYRFFKFLFWSFLFFLSLNIYNELFTKNLSLALVRGNYSVGYKIPARLSLTLYDSIVSYNYDDEFNYTSYYKKGDDLLNNSLIDSSSISPNSKRSISINETAIKTHCGKENFISTSSSIKSDIGIRVKSSIGWLNVLLCMNAYSSVIFAILLVYFLKQIFNILNRRIEFSLELFKNVKCLGLLLVFATLFKFLVSFIFSFYYELMTITSRIDNTLILNPTNVLIRPRLNFNIWIFIIGIALIIFSELLKNGNQIQQENDLTV
ncbi:DUF2975 domain-containing protein [Winogradskyella wichelsiae]|uniref:DUF2975 domain-containing protein n=1 Tax=Winogradskyella wichelsiae TaxID=2697007 RepID=UPI0015C9A20B|nr:DUF2975 domain-containing protein [Winogradskyella wichelsiae]